MNKKLKFSKIAFSRLAISFAILLAIAIPNASNASISEKIVDQKELECLAKNIFFEAHGTDFDEMNRVANVTINRLRDQRYPKTICGVVLQRKQFSWTSNRYNDMKKIIKITHKNKDEKDAWASSQHIALLALNNGLMDNTKGSLVYHANYIRKPHGTFWKKTKLVFKSMYHSYYTIS